MPGQRIEGSEGTAVSGCYGYPRVRRVQGMGSYLLGMYATILINKFDNLMSVPNSLIAGHLSVSSAPYQVGSNAY